MDYSPWLGPYGWGIFFVGVVIAIILFAVKKKFFPVFYLASVSTYIFTIGFVIDAFQLGKNIILLLLALSATLFILLGFYFTHRFESNKENFARSVSRKN